MAFFSPSSSTTGSALFSSTCFVFCYICQSLKGPKIFFFGQKQNLQPNSLSQWEPPSPVYNCTGEPAEVLSSNVSKKEYCFYIEKKKQSKSLWSCATRWQKSWVSLLRSGLWVWTPQAQHNIFKWLCKARERLSALSCLFGGEHEDTAELNWAAVLSLNVSPWNCTVPMILSNWVIDSEKKTLQLDYRLPPPFC